LYLYKKVYTEVVEALPVNGGAYNCLLNGTSKSLASIAGVMTFLSYMVTAVISGKVGIQYLLGSIEIVNPKIFETFAFSRENTIMGLTIGLLLMFALLVISGLKDSAKVASAIFVLHLSMLTIFTILSGFYIFNNNLGLFFTDAFAKTADLTIGDGSRIFSNGLWFESLLLAFATSMLGITGFESSANFVEEQKKGVFRKTLRNMFFCVMIFNPLICFGLLNALNYEVFSDPKKRDFLMLLGAQVVGGDFFAFIMGIDGFLVLSGAVITAYVGVSGLLSRMAADNCIPSMLAKVNKNEAFPFIVWLFFLMCSYIMFITKGNLYSLAGVYTISFLGVMSLFALGNLILKETRKDLKRTYRANRAVVMIALLSTVIGIVGNIKVEHSNLGFFATYFIPVISLSYIYIYRDLIIKFVIRNLEGFPYLQNYFIRHFENIIKGEYIVFVNSTSRLATIFEYITKNETGLNLRIIHCSRHEHSKTFDEIKNAIPVLQKAGVGVDFNIHFMQYKGVFTPGVIDQITKELKIPRNNVFMGSIHENHKFDYEDLIGVRIIF
jgi:amino acid transporter